MRSVALTMALSMAASSGLLLGVSVALLYHADEPTWGVAHRNASIAVLAAVAVLAGLVGVWTVRRALSPVRELTRRIEQIQCGDQLSVRVFHEALPVELVPLATAFDELLDRIEAAYTRLSTFAAYAAHELRTPLQILSGEAETALREERTHSAYRKLLESSLEEYRRLSELVNNLMFIAQAWDPNTQIERIPIDVRTELDSIREYFEPLAAEAGQLIFSGGHGRIDADPCLLRRAVCNLVANALRHTPPMGRISLWVEPATADSVSIKVTDTGCGIRPEHLARIRAARGWVASAAPIEPAKFLHGLGLQIVGSIVELHDARLRIDSEPGRGTTVELLFPKAASHLTLASSSVLGSSPDAASMAAT